MIQRREINTLIMTSVYWMFVYSKTGPPHQD